MKTFVDSLQRTWEVCVNVIAFKRVKAMTGFDLYSLIKTEITEHKSDSEEQDGDNFSAVIQLQNNEILLGSVMYAICKPECDGKNISEDDFYRGFTGDTIRSAFEALMKEYADFFPNPKHIILAKQVEMLLRALEVTTKNATSEMSKLDVEEALKKAETQSLQNQ